LRRPFRLDSANAGHSPGRKIVSIRYGNLPGIEFMASNRDFPTAFLL
jgi:hypothetical protein